MKKKLTTLNFHNNIYTFTIFDFLCIIYYYILLILLIIGTFLMSSGGVFLLLISKIFMFGNNILTIFEKKQKQSRALCSLLDYLSAWG